MKSLVKYLQKYLAGEVLTGQAVRQAFSRDGGLIARVPQAVIFVRNENDIRKTLLFASQAAKKGSKLTVTTCGGGSDLSGAAVGEGLVLAMSAYHKRIISVNDRQGVYIAEAGITISALQQFLAERGSFLPACHSLPPHSTLGGAVANNSYSRYSLKYGTMVASIKALKVVLSDGSVMTISKLSRNQVKKKLLLDNLEGEIYREIERLFAHEDSRYYYKQSALFSMNQAAANLRLSGYDISELYSKDGSLNLVPLFCGSQGSLGVITTIEFQAVAYNRLPQALLLCCDSWQGATALSQAILELKPASLTMFAGACFAKLRAMNPLLLSDFQGLDQAQVVLIVEFDEFNKGKGYKKVKQVLKLAANFQVSGEMVYPLEAYDNLDRLRSALTCLLMDGSDSIPYLISGFWGTYVPLEHLADFYQEAQSLFESHKLEFMPWGEIALGNINLLLPTNLTTSYGRNRFIKLLRAYWSLVYKYQGRAHIANQEGIYGSLVKSFLSNEQVQLLQTIKILFDPQNLLNHDIKLNASSKLLNDLIPHDWSRFQHHLLRLG